MTHATWLAALLVLAAADPKPKAPDAVEQALAAEIIGPRQTLLDLKEYIDPRIPRMPKVQTTAAWETQARRIRQGVLDRVVFRGAAARWRDGPPRVEWQETIPGGPGYRIKKLRYQAVPGLWIPALLYEPEGLTGKVPVHLAVNGHDRTGKAAPYKQIRCINLAKRGVVSLNVEWLGMGQLNRPGLAHYRMNQLDLCGTSGVAPFYLAMTRGLDVLLGLPQADPARVAVSGLSGGGWQTIFVSSLDPRVTLSNPVAGYSSFLTRLHHAKDLGDSEQTPCDLATVADYTHLTALRAPRPTLLTFNGKDNCCFEAGYALPPLLATAGPIFRLYDRDKALRSHVNEDPGTHNYGLDNRQTFYRMVGDFFFPGDTKYSEKEIPSKEEVHSPAELTVELPTDNADFNTLALALARDLPRGPALPTEAEAARRWQAERRAQLRAVVAAADYLVEATRVNETEKDGLHSACWKLRLGKTWTVPVVELRKGTPRKTVLLVNDAGRKADPVNARRLLAAGYRVVAVDPFYFGEARLPDHDALYALLLAATGGRPLGVQAGQLAAVARWAQREYRTGPVTLVAVGPRLGIAALVAAGLEEKAIGRLELHGALGSLKEVIEQSRAVNQTPELFCFGLLEAFDVKQLVALAAPRPVTLPDASERARKELADVPAWYRLLGRDFDPLEVRGTK